MDHSEIRSLGNIVEKPLSFFSKIRWSKMGVFLLAVGMTWALDDLPVYYDAGCSDIGVPKWYVQASSADLQMVSVNGSNTLPIDCQNKYRGTDAVIMKMPTDVGSGGYYDIVMKFGDDKSKWLNGYKDVRFRVKNLGSAQAKIRPLLQNGSYGNQWTNSLVTVSAGADWDEIVVPLSDFNGFNTATDSLVGFGFCYNWNAGDTPSGSAMDLLIDDIRITDGTDHEILAVPALGGGDIPALWTDHFLVGSFDNRDQSKTSKDVQAGEYRYEYIMPETMRGEWGVDHYAEAYATKSMDLGVKSAFVWYHLGKVSESAVATNLVSSSFMTEYIDWYESFLADLAAVQKLTVAQGQTKQDPFIIVLEPDMYGKLMQDGHMPNMLGEEVDVDMSRASAITGKTYASNLVGWAEYMVGRARDVLNNQVVIGHMLNHWGVNIPGQIGQGRIEAHIMGGYAQGNFLNSLGAGKGDVVFVEKTDRDAGIKLTEKPNEDWFWNDTNYTKYFSWIKCLSVRSNLRVVGWQVSEGNSHHPSNHQDDAMEYFVAHPDLWANAGFIGILFGAGLEGNANYPKTGDDDNGFFVQSINNYYQSVYTLPKTLNSTPVKPWVQKAIASSNSQTFWGRCGHKMCVTGQVDGNVWYKDLRGRSLRYGD